MWMRLVTLGLIVVGILLVPPPGRCQEGFRTHYQRGVTAFHGGDLLAAASEFEQALQHQAESPAGHFALGQVYQALFERTGLYYLESVEAYETVLRSLGADTALDSPRQLVRVFLGQLRVRGGEYAQAVELLREFLELPVEYREAEEIWNSIGVAHYYLNEYHEAVRAFEQALEHAPEYAPARFNLRSVFTRLSLFDVAMANRRLGRLDLAIEGIDQLLEMAPRYLPARLQRALMLRELGRDEEAEAEARRSLSFGTNDQVRFELHELLGDLLADKAQTEAALAEYRKCLQIFPGYVQVVEKMDALEMTRERSEAPKERSGPSFEADRVEPVMQFPM